jgi:hypothetical protein
MTNNQTTNDIDALLRYLASAAENPHTKTPIGITAAGFYAALYALVAERDSLLDYIGEVLPTPSKSTLSAILRGEAIL